MHIRVLDNGPLLYITPIRFELQAHQGQSRAVDDPEIRDLYLALWTVSS